MTTPPAATPTPAPASVPVPSNFRAGTGQLRAEVARVLSDRAGSALSVTEIARLLGHSGGAVGNACQTLADRGEATLTGSRPRRYEANSATAAAAVRAVITPPRTSSPPPPATAPTPPAPAPSAARPAPAAGTGPAGAKDGRPVPIMRPGGQRHHPRALAGLPDVEALQRLRAAGVPALLYGPPGTGKTSLVEAAFPDLVTVAGDGDTTVGDLVGEYTQNALGGYEFLYGPLVTAMQEGRALLLDDATLVSPKVLAALYPALDGRRQIQVKAHKGETITATDGFYVIAGHNPGVHGAVLTEALASRFSVQVQVGTFSGLRSLMSYPARFGDS